MSIYPYCSEEVLIDAAREGMALARYALHTPDRPAVYSPWGTRTWGELNGQANQLVRALRRIGLRAGDPVALHVSNRPEFIEVYKAALRAGWRLTPINWHLSGDEVAYIVTDCEARVFITEDRFHVEAQQVVESVAELDLCVMVSGEPARDPFTHYRTLLDAEDPSDIEDPDLGRYMLYTSGTTGRPKGVYRDRWDAILPVWSDRRAPMVPLEDGCLLTGPAYHAAPLVNLAQALISGIPLVMMDRWEPEETLALIARHRVTHTHMVATMFHRMLQLPDAVRGKYDVSSIKSISHGAAPCPVHVKRAMIEWFGPVLDEYYAATEGGGGFNVDSETWLKKPGTVGKAPPAFDNRILDEEGNEAPVGEVGTIYMKAPEQGRFAYYKDDEKTGSAYRGDYFTLGDMGYFDEDGYLFLTGRSAEVIISGGVNIYPQEVDTQIMQHEAVEEVCTIGIPNDEWGEEVRAVVQLKPGWRPSDELSQQLIEFAREKLPGYKCPRAIDYAEDLPRLPTGKIQRRKVRDPYWQGHGRSI